LTVGAYPGALGFDEIHPIIYVGINYQFGQNSAVHQTAASYMLSYSLDGSDWPMAIPVSREAIAVEALRLLPYPGTGVAT
jgi:hypothetical protein